MAQRQKTIWRWAMAGLLLAWLMGTGVPASAESGQTPYQQLQALVELAPNREMGQPGNDAIDRFIQQRFRETVERANADRREQWEHAQQLLAAAERANADLFEAQRQRELLVQSEAVTDSSWLVMYTLEQPRLLVGGLLLLAAVMLVCGRYQQRPALIWTGMVLAVSGAGLWGAAVLIETPAERQTRLGSETDQVLTTGLLDRRIEEAANAVLQADVQAARQLRGLWQAGRAEYPTAVFRPGKTTMTLDTGYDVPLFQLAPNLVDPGNLPAGGFAGRLVYVGQARPRDLENRNLSGAAVVVDFDSGRRWIDMVQLGAELIIVLEPPTGRTMRFGQAVQKRSFSPLSVPRLYWRYDDLVSAFGPEWQRSLAAEPQVHISQQPGRWSREYVGADWLFIPASGSDGEASTELVHLQAYKDSASVVPELSPGAGSAGNLVLMLRLLEQFERTPPERPVLLSVVNAHTNGLQGEQEFAFTAFGRPDAVLPEIEWAQRELIRQRFIHRVYSQQPTPGLLDRLRVETVSVAGQMLKSNKPILDRLRGERNALREAAAGIHVIIRQGDGQAEDYASELAAIDEQIESLNRLMGLFNRFGRRVSYDELTARQQQQIHDLFQKLAQEADEKARELAVTRQRLHENLGLRRRLLWLSQPDMGQSLDAQLSPEQAFARRHEPLPALMAMTLDLSFDAAEMGLFAHGHFTQPTSFHSQARQRVSRLADYAMDVSDDYEQHTGRPSLLVDTVRNVGGVPWNAYLSSKLVFGARVFHQFGVAGLTLTSVRDARPREYTPHDTVERIRPQQLNRSISFAQDYLPLLINGPELRATRRRVGRSDTVSIELSVRLQDQQSVSIPETPLPNALVTVYSKDINLKATRAISFGQVRPMSVLMADSRGVAMIRGSMWRKEHLGIFHYDPDYREMLATLDMGEAERKFRSSLEIPLLSSFVPRTVVAFESRKVDLIGMTEALTLAPLYRMLVLDAYQDSPAGHFGVIGVTPMGTPKITILSLDGTASVMMPRHGAFKLRLGQGLAINTEPGLPLGRGFAADTGLVRDLVLTSAVDMWRLTDDRLELLESKGVSNDTAVAFNQAAGSRVEHAFEAEQQGSNNARLTAAEEARGLAFRAYTRGLRTINDLIQAVVIFLALVIPFCFFVTKLLSPFTDINRQLAIFGGIFVIMALILRFLHPAFEVAQTPSIVILAFVMLGLAIYVSLVLMSRFNGAMNQAVEQSQLSEATDASQGRLAGVAFLVGVNNMKRRRIRTSLTCATIVLVTFTMLSVISVGQDVDPARVRVARDAPYNGFLYARPGLSPLADLQVHRLRAHFDGRATVIGRVWGQRLGTFNEYLPYVVESTDPVAGAPAQNLETRVLLGLEVAEHGFLGPMPILPGGRWFSSNRAAEALLSVEAAALLGITPENFREHQLLLQGERLQLIGLLDDAQLEAMKDISGLPLMPLQMQATQDVEDEQAALAEASGAASLDAGGDLAAGADPMRPVDVLFVPVEFARSLGSAEYHLLSVKYADTQGRQAAEAAWHDASHLVRFQHARVQVGIQEPVTIHEGETVEAGQYSLASSSTTEIGGIIKIAIPIILAGTIILNTMLGSVMERRREVGIYNAIGLNPSHVMMFFLAESLVFGLVGSVSGYLIGQALSLVITRTNLVDLNLNYSSLSVTVVIFLTISTVLLSTVYPAMMAARAAVPSGQRRWSLPQPDGDEIHVQFPFSYDAARVLGVCAYLRDYMQQNSEATTGRFLARLGPVGFVPTALDNQQDKAYAMVFDVAPAPYDLGVNQKMEVYAYYDPHVQAHMLSVHLTRISGEAGSWVRVNQGFLESLRKRLLGWRSQKESTQQAYCQQGEQLFAEAEKLPVQPGSTQER